MRPGRIRARLRPAPTAGGSVGVKTGKTGKQSAASVVGTLQLISGSKWTVKKADGSTVQVTITPATHFGTKAKPETMGDFKTGATVLVVTANSAADQSAVTAKRVVDQGKAPMTTAAPTTTAPTTA